MTWLRPETLSQALNWLDEYNPTIVCGGTDTFVNWPRRQLAAEGKVWLNIQQLSELNKIHQTEEGVEIGSAVTAAQIWQNDLCLQLPALQQASKIVGGWQIQNRASLGGNIANASPAADMVVPLIAYQAKVKLIKKNDVRVVPVSDFILGPRETGLQKGELLASIIIPRNVLGVPQIFLRLDQRGATDISLVSVALLLSVQDGEIISGSTAVGAANPYPFSLPHVDDEWKGRITPEKIENIASAYSEGSNPITDVRASAEYRKAMVKVLIQRAAYKICKKIGEEI